ncbi:unnamed protein product [Rotaria sordida]|uniref:Uncharacterized protein n=1 Tax=Rotaria sordida TaxID=392033 RepID=A0A814J1E7_9BILA|nr:unnamed protein product [Rotaria sordida]CAF3933259.1 unnamed protein product [Rotaria sordida]
MIGNDLLGKRHKFCEATDLYKTYDNHHLVSKLLADVIHYCLNEYLVNQSNNTENLEYQTTRKQIEIIQGCFREDIEKQDDLTYFIKAYSRTTCFYKELNKHLAFYILKYFDKTKHFSSNYRLKIYILNRSFLSTSIDCHAAEIFAGEDQQIQMAYTPESYRALQYSCVCQYIIKQNLATINMESLSIRPAEKDILIVLF